MQSIHYLPATLVEFGPGREVSIASHIIAAGITRILICYGSENVRQQGLFQAITRQLTRAGVAWTGYGGLVCDETPFALQKAISRASEAHAHAILSVGGGAMLDNMKDTAVTTRYCGEPWMYYIGKDQHIRELPVYALLTLPSKRT